MLDYKGIKDRAGALQEELVEIRRKVHHFGGLGFDIPETSKLVFDTLTGYGLGPQRLCETGVVCCVGKPGPTILLRADMDALPIEERTGLPFAAENGTMHACGHDLHTAMLLGAARLLKERETELPGTVKLMFQPAEEALDGCRRMVEAGVLENPAVDAALAFHVIAGDEETPTGGIKYVRGVTSGACNVFAIEIRGKGCHGAYPERGVDPINIAARIVSGAQELVGVELPAPENGVLTFGRVQAGTAANVIPETAVLEGTIRTLSQEARSLITQRLEVMARATAESFGGSASVRYPLECGLCICDIPTLDLMLPAWAALCGGDNLVAGEPKAGSEDFGYIMERVPSVQASFGAGRPSEGYLHRNHLPESDFDERVLSLGAALYAASALRWLEETVASTHSGN